MASLLQRTPENGYKDDTRGLKNDDVGKKYKKTERRRWNYKADTRDAWKMAI